MRAEKLYLFSGVHLYYEIDMCYRTASLLAGAADGVLNNVLVESYALHLRNLFEFLYGTPRKLDDLNAVHYVKSKEPWLQARGRASEPLTTAKQRADKQIAHFTKKRFADHAPEKRWQPGLEIAALLPGLQLFLEHADPERLHPHVRTAIARLATLVPA